MQVEMKADDGTVWKVSRDTQILTIVDAAGNQRLQIAEGGITAAAAINLLAKQDREKKAVKP